ncbi:Ig-like domain-containing protein [Brachybacterium sp. FME24]|uniref:Ig-like domain-containing protein n=1 Tax=Brachybacterium sp. FME24 TaxID=2742605 RepID=UPI0027151FF6|nr:Ig-like domain-containing protein [Brachybacterium sp. FME24]
MPEQTPRPRSRAGLRRVTARVAALAAAGMLAASLTLPAAALGEDGPFAFPTETETVAMVPGAVTRLPLWSLVEDSLEDEVDADSARLAMPEEIDEGQRSLMELSEDGRTLTVAGEGTWSLIGQNLVFTPLSGVEGPSTPIAMTIEGFFDSRSEPAMFTPELLELEEIEVRGSAGEVTDVQLSEDIPEGGTVRLELAGLPAGSTLVADGSRATIPEQGVWQLSADGGTLSHSPAGLGLGLQLDPVRLVVEDAEGAVVRAAEVWLTVPIISDLDWSAPFGQDISFVVGEGQQHVDPETLRLEPLAGEEGAQTTQDRTEVVVPGQGTWVLNRDSATVRFSPESADVRVTAPMGIVGGDGEGATSATALLSTAYPILVDRAAAAAPGTEVQFDLTTGIRDVRSDSLRFDPDAVPEGADLSEDGTEVVVEGEGTWRIDFESRTVTMTPAEAFTGTTSPVGITAQGVFADNPVDATLEATFSPVIATMRDDEQRTAPLTPVTVDVLSNDTAGSGSQPLDPASVEIASLSATNLTELDDGRGTRLVIPGEGTYTVDANGSVMFTPAEGFVGRTAPVTYHVLDSEGIPTTASFVVDVDRNLTGASEPGPEVSGINSLLAGLMPSAPATSVVFGTIVLLLLFAGGVALWVGIRMEADKRTWED